MSGDYLDALARNFQGRELLVYNPHGISGETFIETMPPAPDSAVRLSLYGARKTDPRNGWEVRSLQVRVRGTPDPRISRTRCEALYGALPGLVGVRLSDGFWLVLAVAAAAPVSVGIDENGRHEYVVNVRLTPKPPRSPRHP